MSEPQGLAKQASELLQRAHQTNRPPHELLATWESVRLPGDKWAHEGLGLVLWWIKTYANTQDLLAQAEIARHLDLAEPKPIGEIIQATVVRLSDQEEPN